MEQNWQLPFEIKIVPDEATPPGLFVCSAKIKAEAGLALKGAFEAGAGLPRDLEAAYREHLIYAYELGEKNSCWEAGPAADFTEILYVFAADSLEAARKLMHDDPFYASGIFYDDNWFEWHIHSPLWKTNVPAIAEGIELKDFGIALKYPPGVEQPVEELRVSVMTPPKLIVSFARGKEGAEKIWQPGTPPPAFIVQHLFNRAGPGGMGPMGYDWESGPSIDRSYDLTILSVNSIEMAKLLRENDASVRYGFLYDCRYFEWCIHMPLRKSSPQHKETLRRFLRDAGVKLGDD